MAVEILLTRQTDVFNYNISTSGTSYIGSLIRVDNERGYSLDLFQDETIPINYQISDIKDPSQKTSPFSKSFQIPGTKRNMIAMEFAYMMSTDVPFIDYRGEVVNGDEWHLPVQEAQIFVDGILAFTGKLELTKAIINEGETNSFEVNFLATQINIFDEIENKNVRELTLPSFFINSSTDVQTIFDVTSADEVFTVDGTDYNGFTLAYPDWGFQGATAGTDGTTPNINATTEKCRLFTTSSAAPDPYVVPLQFGYNFLQYAFLKTIVDKIFEGTNFAYSSNFFESEEFKKLLLLAYDSREIPSNSGLKIFGSSPSANTYYPDVGNSSSPSDFIINNVDNLSASGQVPSASPFDADEYLGDPFGIYDSESGVFRFNRTGTFRIRMKAVIDIRFGWDMEYDGVSPASVGVPTPCTNGLLNVYPWDTYPLIDGNGSYFFMECQTRTTNIVSSAISSTSEPDVSIATPSTYTKNNNDHMQWEASVDEYTTPHEFIVSVRAGDEWKMKARLNISQYWDAPMEAGLPPNSPSCTPFFVIDRKYQVAFDAAVEDISPIFFNWNQTLPDMSQKDFLSAIIKHFNLYTEIAPSSRAIIMEPRDDFYSGGTPQDWTPKVDISSAREIAKSEPPLEVFARMEKTDNFLDVQVQNTTSDELEYGSIKITLPNGQDETTEIQSPFASLTPTKIRDLDGRELNYTYDFGGDIGERTWNIPNPALFSKADDGTRELTEESGMYLAYRPLIVRSPKLNTSNAYAFFRLPPTSTSGEVITYLADGATPLSDHLWSISTIGGTGSASYEGPGLDVNFERTRTTMFSGNDTPPVFLNMETNWERFYANFFENLNSQKVVTIQARLNAADIARFSFRNPVWITFPNGDGDYFIVSSIQYDPTTVGTSTVELLTFDKRFFNFSISQQGGGGIEYPGPEFPAEGGQGSIVLPPDQTGEDFPIDNAPTA